MTDRVSLGVRIAEAMGWSPMEEHPSLYVEPFPRGKAWPVTEIVSWPGYGVVDAWVREQGWSKDVEAHPDGDVVVRYYRAPDYPEYTGVAGDEPLAAIQAALKALEARE